MPPNDFRTRKQISEDYQLSISTLKRLSARDAVGGPPVIRVGDRVFYHVPSFEEWLTSSLTKKSGSPPQDSTKRRRGRPRKSEQVAARG